MPPLPFPLSTPILSSNHPFQIIVHEDGAQLMTGLRHIVAVEPVITIHFLESESEPTDAKIEAFRNDANADDYADYVREMKYGQGL